MLGPAQEHPVGGGTYEHIGRCRFPGQVGWLGQALVGLDLGELGEAPPVGLVAGAAKGGAEHRICPGPDRRAVAAPHPTVDHHLVADPEALYLGADRIDDARGVAAADVEGDGVGILLAALDYIDRATEGCPDIVVVDPSRHDIDKDLVRLEGWHLDLLDLKGLDRLSYPLPTHQIHTPPTCNC